MAAVNGATSGPYRTSSGALAADPMSGVIAMGPRIPVAIIVAIAVVLHGGAAAGGTAAALLAEIVSWNRGVRDAVGARLAQTYDIDVAKPQELPPEPPKEEPKEPEPPPVKEQPKEAPPPQPAEAAKVIATDPDPHEVLDMRDSIVQGTGETYAGGVTAASGTSKQAVYNTAATPTGVPGGTGTAPAPPAPARIDRSRGATLSGSSDWSDCPFPPEADAEQVDQAFVTLQVKVRPDGAPDAVSVVQDPGHGFGREARKCAMRKRYANAQDAEGNAIGGTTKPFRVRFQR